jgi:hypothetical protein
VLAWLTNCRLTIWRADAITSPMRRIGFAALLVAALSSPLAPAQQPSDEERARAASLAAEGDVLWGRADFAGALERFQNARRLVPVPSLALREAECVEKLGRWVDALAAFRNVARTRLAPSAPEPHRRAVEEAARRAASLEARLPKVVLALDDPEPQSIAVRVDGRDVPAPDWARGFPVDPGRHRIAASKGSLRTETTVVAEEGKVSRVRVGFESQGGAAPPGSTHRTLGWVALGVGGAGLLLGTVSGAVAMSRRSTLDQSCVDARCPSSSRGEVDGYNTLRTVSTVGFGVGLAGAAAGAVLLLTAPSAPESGSAALVRPWVGPSHAGLAGSVTW